MISIITLRYSTLFTLGVHESSINNSLQFSNFNLALRKSMTKVFSEYCDNSLNLNHAPTETSSCSYEYGIKIRPSIMVSSAYNNNNDNNNNNSL